MIRFGAAWGRGIPSPHPMNMHATQWILRIAVAGEYVGHGVFALQGKEQWVDWIERFTGMEPAFALQLLHAVGYADIVIALIILLYPVRVVLLWAAFWGFWTALIRPLMGDPIWDFIERWANWGAPLALLFLQGWPKNARGWWKKEDAGSEGVR